MSDGTVIRPVATYILIVVTLLLLTAVVGLLAGGASSPDGQAVEGQSPAQYQPSSVVPDTDPESGTINIDASGSGRILVDTRHLNRFDREELEPLTAAAAAEGHEIEFTNTSNDEGLEGELSGYDGYLVIQPTVEYSASERQAVESFTATGGRVVVLAEPTRTEAGGGLIAQPTTVSFGARELLSAYGVQLGAESLYNLDDERNDNNFKSIYANPAGSSALTDGVETVNLDRGGYLVTEPQSSAEPVLTAAAGTRTGTTRRTGSYATAVRNGNMVVVADADVVQPTQLYDVDNEVFVGNMLSFLAGSSIAEPTGSGSDDGATGNGTVETAPGNETAETAAGNGTSGTPTDG